MQAASRKSGGAAKSARQAKGTAQAPAEAAVEVPVQALKPAPKEASAKNPSAKKAGQKQTRKGHTGQTVAKPVKTPANTNAKTAAKAPVKAVTRKRATRPPDASNRIRVRKSPVHGQGVFAILPIAAHETVIEYVGELITWDEALRRHPHDPSQPDHTFYFHIDDARVIDGKVGGNASRWINHSCEPNCEAEEDGDQIFLKAMRDIDAGEELSFDYGLIIDERYTPSLKKRFACHCGSAHCRGTMLAPKR